MRNSILLFALLSTVLFSCNDDEMVDVDNTDSAYSDGVFIVHEGSFSMGSGSISFLNQTDRTVENEIFSANNTEELGSIVQSMTVVGDEGFIISNNSNKITVVDMVDFSYKTVITGVTQPRYMVAINDSKAYVSQWGEDGSIAVLDLNSYTIVSSIPVGTGPGKMLLKGTDLYVCNNGGFGRDSTISILNTNTDDITQSLTIGDNPESIVEDKDGNLWVLASGYGDFSVMPAIFYPGALVKLNGTNKILDFEVDNNSKNLSIDKDGQFIYYTTNSGIVKHNTNSSAEVTADNIIINSSFYGLGIDPVSGNVYTADAGDFASRGKVQIYSTTGSLLESYSVGLAPNGFYFNN